MTNAKQTAGERLRQYKERMKWSDRELGAALNVSHTHAARLQENEAMPGLALAFRIKSLAKIDPRDWLEERGVVTS